MPWIWTREAASAFNTIREKLTSLTVLAMYDPALPLFLACDASDKELGACIFQHNSAGQEKVFEYASKTLTKAERNYSQIEYKSYQLSMASRSSVTIFIGSAGNKQVISSLSQLFARFGIPKQLATDNGPQFVAKEFSEFCRQQGILHSLTPPYHPQSNGQAERLIQSFKKAVKKGTEESGMNLHDVVHTVYPVNIGVILFSVNSAQLSRT